MAAAVPAARAWGRPGMTLTTDPVKALVAGYEATTPDYGYSWNSTVGYGAPGVVTFAFVEAPGAGEANLSPMGAAARAAAREALAAWAAACGVSFQEVADSGDDGAAMLRFALDTSVPNGSSAQAGYPMAGWYSSELGFKPGYDWDAAAPGNWQFEVMLHEIGHALGLKHSFEAIATNGYTLDPALDDNQHTVMSYTSTGIFRSDPGALDLAAIQYLYGTDAAEQSDGVTWSFRPATQSLSFLGSAASERIAGTHARDVINAGGGGDLLDGLLGNDKLFGGGGADTAWGGSGNDLLNGGAGDDSLLGGTGRDTLEGTAGRDTVLGEWDNDLVLALADGDLMLADWSGNDTVDYRRTAGPIQATATGGPDYLVLVTGGGGGTDTIQGGYETLAGSAYGDTLDLSGGSDVLWVRGGGGNDTICGTPWNDTLSGGAGKDVFDYDAYRVTGNTLATADMITDFTVAASTLPGAYVDRIDLSGIDAIPGSGGDDAFVFRGTAAFSGPGQIRAQAVAAGTLLRLNLDADRTTTEAMILLKGLADPAALQAYDFIL